MSRYGNNTMKSNPTFMSKIIDHKTDALKCADGQNNYDFILTRVKRNTKVLKYTYYDRIQNLCFIA